VQFHIWANENPSHIKQKPTLGIIIAIIVSITSMMATIKLIKHIPSNPDVAPHLKRIIIIIILIFLVLDREWGNDPKDPIHILNLSS
jgi:hypothetical protein